MTDDKDTPPTPVFISVERDGRILVDGKEGDPAELLKQIMEAAKAKRDSEA